MSGSTSDELFRLLESSQKGSGGNNWHQCVGGCLRECVCVCVRDEKKELCLGHCPISSERWFYGYIKFLSHKFHKNTHKYRYNLTTTILSHYLTN